MIWFILVFFLGASVGSFINVMIDRMILGTDWVRGRSHCDHCHKTLAWYDMVPIVSFLVYRARTRCCHAPLTWRYPIVETLVGLLFVWWLAMGFWFFRLVAAPLTVIQPVFWLVTGVILVILALADLFYGVVLMHIVGVGYALILCYRLILFFFGSYQLVDFGKAIVMSAVFFGFFWLLYRLTKGRGMADGDMYVAAYMGLLLGFPKGFVGLMGSFILGAVIGVFLIVTKLRTRHDTVPFVPFMVLAMGIALLWGDQLIRFVG